MGQNGQNSCCCINPKIKSGQVAPSPNRQEDFLEPSLPNANCLDGDKPHDSGAIAFNTL